MLDELIDRYGDPPPSVSDLVNVSLVRVQATAVGVYEVTQKKDTIVLQLEHLDVPMIRGLLVAFNGRVTAGQAQSPTSRSPCNPTKSRWNCCKSILRTNARRWQRSLPALHMKKKLLALVCALALTFSLAGCGLSTPDTVGSIGDFEDLLRPVSAGPVRRLPAGGPAGRQ